MLVFQKSQTLHLFVALFTMRWGSEAGKHTLIISPAPWLQQLHRNHMNLSSPILRCCLLNLPGVISLIVAIVCFCLLRVLFHSTMFAILWQNSVWRFLEILCSKTYVLQPWHLILSNHLTTKLFALIIQSPSPPQRLRVFSSETSSWTIQETPFGYGSKKSKLAKHCIYLDGVLYRESASKQIDLKRLYVLILTEEILVPLSFQRRRDLLPITMDALGYRGAIYVIPILLELHFTFGCLRIVARMTDGLWFTISMLIIWENTCIGWIGLLLPDLVKFQLWGPLLCIQLLKLSSLGLGVLCSVIIPKTKGWNWFIEERKTGK